MAFAHLINKINALQQELASLQPLPADRQEKLDRKFRLEFNYNSNHIEGNTLTYGETELYLIFDKTTGDHSGREYEEMKASDAALRMIQEYALDKERPLTESFIKELHKLILVRPYWADAMTPSGQPTRREIKVGQYKSQPNSVRLQNGEMFHYASPEETPSQMGDLIQWYRDELEKQELHPVALAALLHYKFVRIHPFDDGNGRMSRLLMNYVLYVHGLPPVIVKSADKKNYLFALNKADSGDIDAFVEYVGEQMLWSLEISAKAGKGEDIEEKEDLYKEIEIWKKGIERPQDNNILLKNEHVIAKIYTETISPFVIHFENKMRIFKDLFVLWKNKGLLNGNEEKGDRAIIDIILGNPISFMRFTRGDVNTITLLIQMSGLKSNLNTYIDIITKLEVTLNAYNYQISLQTIGNQLTIIKPYYEILSKEESLLLTDRAIKETFEYIKSQTEKYTQ